jgi:hypothetical protein
VVHLSRQQVVLTPDGFLIDDEWDFCAFSGLRLYLALSGRDILSADCGALG